MIKNLSDVTDMDNNLVSLSVCESNILLDSIEENRRDVENLAMTTINSLQIPLLNSMLCLTKEDCKCILERSNHCTNAVEQSLLLIAVTDFMSCVCANDEMFPISMRRCDTSGIKACLTKLENSWSKFFYKISAEDLSINQFSSITSLLKRCLERMPNLNYKMIMEVILKMSEKAINRVNRPLEEPMDKEKIYCSVKKKKISKNSTSNIVLTESHFKDKLENHLPQGITTSNKKKLKNMTCDITRFILKPCENLVAHSNDVPVGDTLGKRKNEVLTEEEHMNTGAVKDPIDIGSPPCKKQCLDDDFVDGKVNAFKRMMMSQNIRDKKLSNNLINLNRKF